LLGNRSFGFQGEQEKKRGKVLGKLEGRGGKLEKTLRWRSETVKEREVQKQADQEEGGGCGGKKEQE